MPVPVAFPAESRGRMRGQRGRAAHVPPRHDVHSAGNSPEPSDPPSARAGTGRKPRGTVNPAARARRASPRQSSLPGARHGAVSPSPVPKKPPPPAHQMVHEPLATLRGDDAQVGLAAVGGQLGAVRGWRRRRGLGRDDFAQGAAVGDGEEARRGAGAHVAVACGENGHEEEVRRAAAVPQGPPLVCAEPPRSRAAPRLQGIAAITLGVMTPRAAPAGHQGPGEGGELLLRSLFRPLFWDRSSQKGLWRSRGAGSLILLPL